MILQNWSDRRRRGHWAYSQRLPELTLSERSQLENALKEVHEELMMGVRSRRRTHGLGNDQ